MLPSGGTTLDSRNALQAAATPGVQANSIGAGSGSGQQQGIADQPAAAAETGAGMTTNGGGPPWSQAAALEPVGEQKDPRVLGMIAAVVLSSLGFVGVGLAGLRRLHHLESQAAKITTD